MELRERAQNLKQKIQAAKAAQFLQKAALAEAAVGEAGDLITVLVAEHEVMKKHLQKALSRLDALEGGGNG